MYSVHMVRPYDEADHTDGNHRIGHAEIAEHWLAAKGRDDLADHSETGQDHNVHFGVTEEPEQMLIKNWIAAASRIEEGCAKITIGNQHGDRSRQYRQCEQQKECGDQYRPNKQRHFVQGHTRRAHVENGGDEVGRAKDRACAR